MPYRVPLEAHYLYRCFTGSWAIQFNEEHPLVCAKLELSTNDRDGFASAKSQMLAVSMAVGRLIFGHIHCAYSKVIVAVVPAPWRDVIQ
jgi:hypothetical protein